jgi:hypothetical protein
VLANRIAGPGPSVVDWVTVTELGREVRTLRAAMRCLLAAAYHDYHTVGYTPQLLIGIEAAEEALDR